MLRVLRNGRIIDVDDHGRATFETCIWLVQVPTALLYPAPSPEEDPDGLWEPWYPDSADDLYTIIECGARCSSLDGTLDHTTCDAGHDRHAYGTPECERDNIAAEIEALRDEGFEDDAMRFALDLSSH